MWVTQTRFLLEKYDRWQCGQILLKRTYDELKAICTKFQDESGATHMKLKTLQRELARVYEKDIDDDYDIDWEV